MNGAIEINGMPLLVDEITSENAAGLATGIHSWGRDLVAAITCADEKLAQDLSVLLLDVLVYYDVVVRVLSTGKAVPLAAHRWFSVTDLAKLIEHLAYSEADLGEEVIAGLARRLGQMAAEVTA